MTQIIKKTNKKGIEYSVRADRRRYFFPNEWIKFINSIKNKKHRFFFITCLHTGGRIMEVLNLRYKDINVERGTITFEVVKQRKANKFASGKSRGFFVASEFFKEYKSFVGMHPVPVVHGMTIGEYALMVNEERWMKNEIKCNLKIVKLSNYNRNKIYNLSVHPSPNLQTTEAILLYPSLCFFEGTNVSIGRGTEHPFEIIGSPEFSKGSYSFIPKSIKGVADNPKYLGKKCNGYYLKEFANNYLRSYYHLYLFWLKGFYDDSKNKSEFFTSYFDKLAGSDKLRKQIIAGKTIEEIQKSWEEDLLEFLKIREKYLLYPDISIEGKLLRAK